MADSEKAPLFTVTDRRKFTTDGALRPGVTAAEIPVTPPVVPPPAESPALEAAHEAAHPQQTPAPGQASPEPSKNGPVATSHEDDGEENGLIPEPTDSEAAEQHAAYQETTRTLDEMVAKQNPRARAAGPMTFDRLVQSLYMTAAIQLGAGGQPGEQPRVDILGARQSIDMLSVLADKTKGNTTEEEQRLLQNALFELRMSFLEITNAIATSAQSPAAQAMGGKPGFRA
jgi:hypothetical protein